MDKSSQTTEGRWELLEDQSPHSALRTGLPFFWINGSRVHYAYLTDEPAIGWDFICMNGPPHHGGFLQTEGWLRAYPYTEVSIVLAICGDCGRGKSSDGDYLCEACRAL